MKWCIIFFGLIHVLIFIGSCIGLLFLPLPQSGMAATPGNVTYTWVGESYICSGQGNVTGMTTVYIQLIQPTHCLAPSTVWDYGKAFWFGISMTIIYGISSLIVIILTWKYYHRPTLVSRISIPAITEISVISESSIVKNLEDF